MVTGEYLAWIRDWMKEVVAGPPCSCDAHAIVTEIRKNDLHVGEPSKPAGYAKRIISHHPGLCQGGHENIPKGSEVYWNRSTGVWCRQHWKNQYPVASGGHWEE